jgi:dTDP-4-dehydrorhamnose 3,5-epimerase
MPFEFQRLEIPDVVLITPRVFPDGRGEFMETFKHSDFAEFGIDLRIGQVNESVSRRGTLRGLHYQLRPQAQGKLVRALAGSVVDVAVDLRRDSPSFGNHVAARLDANAHAMMWIPEGFAHGFCALADDTRFLYMQTAEYAPGAERGIHPLDSELAIDWGLPEPQLLLSAKDRQLPGISDAEHDFRLP